MTPKKTFFTLPQIKKYLLDYCNSTVECSLPSTLIIGVTNRCNISCPFCFNHLIKEKADMAFSSFKRIIDTVKPFINLVDFSFNGEPLLNKNILHMISYAKKQGLHTILFTNGTLLDHKTNTRLIQSGIDSIIINLNVWCENFSFQHVSDLKKEGKEKINGLINFAANTKALVIVKLLVESKKAVKDIPLLKKEIHLTKNSRLIYQWKEDYDYITPGKKKKISCHKLFHQLVIMHNGDVVLCCNDILEKHIMGNIFTDDIRKVWKNRMNDIRKNNQYQLCLNCIEKKQSLAKMICSSTVQPLPLRKLFYSLVFNTDFHR